MFSFEPVGYLKTCFASKNGTPRQPTVSSASKGELKILKSVFNNPNHSIEGIEAFSHVWILFVFHLNSSKGIKAKVKPPRMDGIKTGIFSTRSPHRPNPIGLTLAKLDSVKNDTLYFSGLDVVDGTPILDIKPYIPGYDIPKTVDITDSSAVTSISPKTDEICELVKSSDTESVTSISPKTDICELVKSSDTESNIRTALWISRPPINEIDVSFSSRSLKDIAQFKSGVDKWILKLIKPDALKQCIIDVLKADPRSSYRRQKCCDRLYYFTIDNAHITAWFDESDDRVISEVLRVKPVDLIVRK